MLAISRALIAATALAVAAQWSHAQAQPAVETGSAEAVVATVPAAPASGAVAASASAPAVAAPVESAVAAAGAAAASAQRIAADTGVVLETAQPLSSASAKRGDGFALRLAEPLVVDGATVLPAGTACHGEVIHAERSRGGGKPGELLLAARYIEHGGRRIALRGFRLSGAGQEKTAAVVGAAIVIGPFAMFVRGGQIEIPAGTRAQARIAEAVDLSAPSPPTPTPTPTSAAAPAHGAVPSMAAAAPAAASPSSSANQPTTGEAVQ